LTALDSQESTRNRLFATGRLALEALPFGLGKLLGRTGGAVARAESQALEEIADLSRSQSNSLNILNREFTPNGRSVLQNLTNRENALLSVDLSRAATVLSPAEQAAAAGHRGIAIVQYGNSLERLVAREIRKDPTGLGSLFKPVGGPGQSDFIGRGFLEGAKYDITTPGQAIRHLNRPYGEGLNIIPYQRPVGFP
jgi:hypothetical protein